MNDPNSYLVLTEQPCGRCDGTGLHPGYPRGSSRPHCPACGGTGRHLTPLVAVLAEILPGLLRDAARETEEDS